MLKETFIGHKPSHFQVNPFVKSFIISETLLWSAKNFVLPIFAVFVASEVAGGSLETAATSFSTYLIMRVIFELTSGQLLQKKRGGSYMFIIIGMLTMSVGYIGLALAGTIGQVFFFYSLMGAGLGLASPAKNSLFSTHLDKNREPAEWGIYDASVFMGMALSAALGGFIASTYGFSTLFLLAAGVNTLAIFPYLIFPQDTAHPSFLNLSEKYIRRKIKERIDHEETTN